MTKHSLGLKGCFDSWQIPSTNIYKGQTQILSYVEKETMLDLWEVQEEATGPKIKQHRQLRRFQMKRDKNIPCVYKYKMAQTGKKNIMKLDLSPDCFSFMINDWSEIGWER